MSLNTLDVKLTPRKETDCYRVLMNDSALDVLKLIFEFKLCTGCHVSRFISQKDKSRYVYMKLRRMWQAGFLESFKVFSHSFVGASLYYMLSKQGLEALEQYAYYERSRLKVYPNTKTLLDWGLFKHEAQVVELASIEVMNKGTGLDISFKGEHSSVAYDQYRNFEALTPDYTVYYKLGEEEVEHCIYTEFERTLKSKSAILRKIQRYADYLKFLEPQDQKNKTLRIIFETPKMEAAFWLNLYLNKPDLLRYVHIRTTHLSLIKESKDFFEAIYCSDITVEFVRGRHLSMDTTKKVKMFEGV